MSEGAEPGNKVDAGGGPVELSAPGGSVRVDIERPLSREAFTEELAARFVESVSIASGVLQWPWVCACCAQRLDDPPAAARPAEPEGLLAVEVSCTEFKPTYCGACRGHIALAKAAESAMPQPYKEPNGNLVGGCCASIFLGPMIIIGVSFWKHSFAAGFWTGVLAMMVLCWWCSETDSSRRAQAEWEHNLKERDGLEKFREAKQAWTATCSALVKAVRRERKNRVWTLHFSNREVAALFRKLNEDTLV